MDTRGKILQNYERRWDLQRLSHQPAYHRRHPIIHFARRLAAHSPGWGFFVPFEPSLETGGPCRFLLVVMLLSHWIRRFQGVIWLVIATAAELSQVVSPASCIIVRTAFSCLTPFYAVGASFFEYQR